MTKVMQGSCTCGQVRFTLDPAKHNVVNCHCDDCRKLSGAAFSTYVAVTDARFELVAGREHLVTYAVSENVTRHFCGLCGTPIYNRSTRYPGLTIVVLGALDNPAAFRPAVNIFCDSRLPWVNLPDGTEDFPREMGS